MISLQIFGWSLLILVLCAMIAISVCLVNKYSRKDWERDIVSPDNLHKVNQKLKQTYQKGNERIPRMAIVTFDDRQDLDYVADQRKIVKMYCEKYDYKQIFANDLQTILDQCKTLPSSKYTKEDYPIYWQKIVAIWAVLNTNQYDYVMWLDSDAALTDKCGPLADIFDLTPDKHLFVVGELWHTQTLNAGVFALRNSEKGSQIIQELLDSYFSNAKHKWSKNKKTNKWECSMCIWAGQEYEQGQLLNIAKKHSPSTLQYHPKQMNYMGWDKFMPIIKKENHVDVLIEHYFGMSESERNANMRKVLQGYTNY